MMKNLLVLSLGLLLSLSAKAYQFVDTSIVFNGTEHILSVCLPDGYDPANPYPLVVAMHYCGGTSTGYRQALAPMSDSLNLIIICPDNNSAVVQDTQLDLISIAVDSAKSAYHINEEEMYLTGMSCNGEMVFRQGMNKFYPFKAIFPWDPWITSVNPSLYNYDSDMPVSLSVGTADPNFATIISVYDSLIAHHADVSLVIVPNIAHVLPTYDEMIRCMYYLNDTNAITISAVADMEMDNNESKEAEVEIVHAGGKNISVRAISGKQTVMSNPVVTPVEGTNTYKVTIEPKEGKKGKVLVVIEAAGEDGAVEQVIFYVNVNEAVSSLTDNMENEFEIVPNPACDRVFFHSLNDNSLDITLLDVNGRTVLKKKNFDAKGSLDISSVAKGLYLVKIKGSETEYTGKLVVE